ncbi:MAG TPA: S9 family peptidase [Galbitalea sp.]|jgi:oligopeptidase B
MTLQPPATEKRPTTRIHHGDTVIDNYEWLRDKADPSVIEHLEAENAYTAEQTADQAALRDELFEEIRAHTKETDLSVPVREGEWWYFTRTVEGKQYGIHCRVPITSPDDWTPPSAAEPLPGEQVLLDANAEAEGHDFFSLGSLDVSADGSLLLWAVDVVGDERYTVRLRDLAGDRVLDDMIENTGGGALFDATGGYVFYTTVDDAWRPDTVWRHAVGTDAASDARVFSEPDERFWVDIDLSRSRRYLLVSLASKITSEVHALAASDPTGEFTVVWPRREGVEYSVEHAVIAGDDRFLIVHNENAVDFEVVDVAASDPRGPRRILAPHTPGTRVDSIDAFAGHLVLEYRRDTLARVAVARLTAAGVAPWQEIEFDDVLFSSGESRNPEWTQPRVRVGFGSFVTPSSVYDYDVTAGELLLLKQQDVPGYHQGNYVQRREWATASDGEVVPISLVYRDDLVRPGTAAPLVLYGYGSYEHSIDPVFATHRLGLLDRGVVFAVAHVRGGGERGRRWYDEGKMLHKRNTFTDFVASARHLIDTGWTDAAHLVAEGGSAGGLLMGAVANLAPEAFAGILAVVPFVDPLTSILDPSLPLTVVEWDEWGNPLESRQVYELMKGYSPYENVADHPYPQILAVTSLNDTRVLYVEPAKWVARLREFDAPVLLKTEVTAGHGGVSGRYEAWRERAFMMAWTLRCLGVAG